MDVFSFTLDGAFGVSPFTFPFGCIAEHVTLFMMGMHVLLGTVCEWRQQEVRTPRLCYAQSIMYSELCVVLGAGVSRSCVYESSYSKLRAKSMALK